MLFSPWRLVRVNTWNMSYNFLWRREVVKSSCEGKQDTSKLYSLRDEVHYFTDAVDCMSDDQSRGPKSVCHQTTEGGHEIRKSWKWRSVWPFQNITTNPQHKISNRGNWSYIYLSPKTLPIELRMTCGVSCHSNNCLIILIWEEYFFLLLCFCHTVINVFLFPVRERNHCAHYYCLMPHAYLHLYAIHYLSNVIFLIKSNFIVIFYFIFFL